MVGIIRITPMRVLVLFHGEFALRELVFAVVAVVALGEHGREGLAHHEAAVLAHDGEACGAGQRVAGLAQVAARREARLGL